jgi:hypothetical protein
MSLVLYSKKDEGSTAEFKVLCESLLPNGDVKTFGSQDELKKWLLTTGYDDEAVVVLMAQKRDELTELLPIIHLFRKVRIILILPDSKPETIKIGYKLEPRFLSFASSDSGEIQAVLAKMLKSGSKGKWAKA